MIVGVGQERVKIQKLVSERRYCGKKEKQKIWAGTGDNERKESKWEATKYVEKYIRYKGA